MYCGPARGVLVADEAAVHLPARRILQARLRVGAHADAALEDLALRGPARGVLVADEAAVHLPARRVLQRALGLRSHALRHVGRAAAGHGAGREARGPALADLPLDLVGAAGGLLIVRRGGERDERDGTHACY